ncbi:MAG: DUF975 family protein [Eubacteriales bacterium]|nr:DUF975 family protein [Eubacteriales bacterium]
MRRGIREWKAYARGALQGNFGMPILGMLAITGITFLGNNLTTTLFHDSSLFTMIAGQIFAFILSLIMGVFSAGLSYMFLNIARGQAHSFGDLLFFFKHHPDRVIVAGFVLGIINVVVTIPYYYVSYITPFGTTLEEQMVWVVKCGQYLILASVLNLLLTLPFVLTYYLLADDLELGGIDALKVSVRMMKGKIGKYLLLQISFIPWMILSVFTLYIGLLWLMPYMEMTNVMFYRDIRGEFDVVYPREIYSSPLINTENPPGENQDIHDDFNSEA